MIGFYSLQAGRRFQTPYPADGCDVCEGVSIPFKREGVSELNLLLRELIILLSSFYSLQTGRRFQTVHSPIETSVYFTFLFPSNGKAFPNISFSHFTCDYTKQFLFPSNGKAFPNYIEGDYCKVCWEFLFPSNGKAFPNLGLPRAISTTGLCFYSLQTGRRFQTRMH